MKRTALYRHFDAEGALLYVGISLNAAARLAQHKEHSAWFSEIANMTIQWFDTREIALQAEFRAVIEERPRYNIRHKVKDIPTGTNVIYQTEKERLLCRVINFKPLYCITEVADLLSINPRQVRNLIESHQLGGILRNSRIVNHRAGPVEIRDYVVSGWHLLDYLESIGAMSKAA